MICQSTRVILDYTLLILFSLNLQCLESIHFVIIVNRYSKRNCKRSIYSTDFYHRAYGLCDGRHWFSYREGALRAALSWQKADGEYGALSDSGLASLLHRF